jgi:hypothetical protein
MRVRLVRKPGQVGTKPYVAEYGARLICVRYRYDRAAKRRYKTIEIVVEEGPWSPPLEPGTFVAVQVSLQEAALQRALKQAGATWERGLRVWQLRYDQALALGLAERVLGAVDDLFGDV